MRRLICLIFGVVLLCFLLTACEPGRERSVVAFSEIQNESTVSLNEIFEEATTAVPVQTFAAETTAPATTAPALTTPATAAPETEAPATEAAFEEETEAPAVPENGGSGYYVLNTNTKKFHLPDCSSVKTMKDKNKQIFNGSREEVIAQGYKPCKRCNP